MKKNSLVFIVVCMITCILPLVGMTVYPTEETTDNRKMAEFPSFTKEDGSVNFNFFHEFEEYFTDHFAFRNELIYADACIQTTVFQVSNVDNVIYGTDGWLYYTSTLKDYNGMNRMSERQIYNLAHNLSLVRKYVEERGSDFVLTIPPNKNTLYGEQMPYYDSVIVDRIHNMDLLTPLLQEKNIPYADLVQMFRDEDEVLYLKRDSHWNGKGALMAYNCIMDALGYSHDDYSDAAVKRVKDEDGDLNRMLYTLYGEKELNYRYDMEQRYSYSNDSSDVEDGWIETEGGTGNGSLLMFRDSFANTLIPFLANQFEKACFTKEVPYGLESLMDEYLPDTVILEKVERNISEYINMPPIISGMETEVSGVLETVESDTSVNMGVSEYDSGYYRISGEIDPSCLNVGTDIIVQVNDVYYDAYHIDSTGYEVYVKIADLQTYPVNINILTCDDDNVCLIQNKMIEEGEILP